MSGVRQITDAWRDNKTRLLIGVVSEFWRDLLRNIWEKPSLTADRTRSGKARARLACHLSDVFFRSVLICVLVPRPKFYPSLLIEPPGVEESWINPWGESAERCGCRHFTQRISITNARISAVEERELCELHSKHGVIPEYCDLNSLAMASLGRHFIILLALKCCQAGMFVMLPSTGKSHFLVFTRLADELTRRGHEVGWRQVKLTFILLNSWRKAEACHYTM